MLKPQIYPVTFPLEKFPTKDNLRFLQSFHDMHQYYWCNGFHYFKQNVYFVWNKDSVKPRSPLLPGIDFPPTSLSQGLNPWTVQVLVFLKTGPSDWSVCFTFIVAPKESLNCEDLRGFSNLHNSYSQLLGRARWHPMVDALPNSTAIFDHRGMNQMATPGILHYN